MLRLPIYTIASTRAICETMNPALAARLQAIIDSAPAEANEGTRMPIGLPAEDVDIILRRIDRLVVGRGEEHRVAGMTMGGLQREWLGESRESARKESLLAGLKPHESGTKFQQEV
jgi:hypothetical protein